MRAVGCEIINCCIDIRDIFAEQIEIPDLCNAAHIFLNSRHHYDNFFLPLLTGDKKSDIICLATIIISSVAIVM